MTTVSTAVARGAGLARRAVGHRRRALPVVRLAPGRGPRTIYYLTPDFDKPSGGVQAMYRHVDLLNAAGQPARVLHRSPRFRCTWFENQTLITNVRATAPTRDDLLVVPEVFASLLPKLTPGTRHIVFDQSGHLAFQRDADAVADHFLHSSDLVAVMTASERVTDLVRFTYPHLEVHRVRLALDPVMFHAPEGERPHRITYLPRRNGSDAELAVRLLRARGALDGWDVRAIRTSTQAQMADELRNSTVFVSTSFQEGFGLPPAEAMACGSYVTGYHGYGGREFFEPRFSTAVDTGDVLGLAQALETVIARERAEPGWCAARGREASETLLSRYSPEAEAADVLAFFAAVQ